MPNDTVSDWSTTPADNTEVGGVELRENHMLGRDVNNAFRTMMSQIATGIDNGEFASVASTASTTEVLTGTDNAKVVTPDALAALWEKGSDVASASTISLGEGGFFHITGTTTITDIDFATAKNGRTAWLEFDGALTLTHNATTLVIPGGANITTAAGDRCLVVQDNSDNVHVLTYKPASGQPVVAVSAASGGTGQTSLTANNVILGNGTSAVQFVAPGTSGNVLTSNGTTWASSAAATGQPIPTSSTFAVGTLVYGSNESGGNVNNGATTTSVDRAAGASGALADGVALTGTWMNVSGATVNADVYGWWVRTA